MKYISLMLFIMPALNGCNQIPNYQLSASTLHLKEIQILDPQAPELNDGITTGLDGSYGEKIIKSYHQSVYDTKAARDVKLMK